MCKISQAYASNTHDLFCAGHTNIARVRAVTCPMLTLSLDQWQQDVVNCLYADPSQPRLGCSRVTYAHYMRVYCHVFAYRSHAEDMCRKHTSLEYFRANLMQCVVLSCKALQTELLAVFVNNGYKGLC